VPASGVLEEGRREDSLAAGREHNVDRVVHATGHDRLQSRPVRSAAKNVRCPRDERLPAKDAIKWLND
jgi:hypothetical protein